MKTPSKSLHLRCLSGLLYKLTFWDFWSFFCHFTMFQNNYKGLRNSLALLFCINFHWFPVWNISQKIKWKYDLIYNPSNISVKYHPIDSINWMTMKQHVHKMMNSTLYNKTIIIVTWSVKTYPKPSSDLNGLKPTVLSKENIEEVPTLVS